MQFHERLMQFIQKHTNDKFYLEGSHSVSIIDKIARELCSNLLIHREFLSGITSRIIITLEKSQYSKMEAFLKLRLHW